ncbi:MAG: low molecular weight protein-tyrosine-phosphatase [Sphingomonadaceae bacterium]
MSKTPSFLFVCLGNICRSPMAEGAFRAAASREGFRAEIDSAGTGNWHIGASPDPRAIATAASHGVDIAGLRARQVQVSDFSRFTHILALDADNLRDLTLMAPHDGTAHVSLLLDHLDGRIGQSVPDPYFGNEADFEFAWQEVSRASEELVNKCLRSI